MPKFSVGKVTFGAIALLAAVLFGLLEGMGTQLLQEGTVTFILVALGLVLGFLNIQRGEATPFMIAAITIMIGAFTLANLPSVGPTVEQVFERIAILVVPAAVVSATRVVYDKIKK